jgi:hypothetical protein
MNASDQIIHFFNHASFSVNGAHATLLCDPYLSGCVGNNGYDLIWRDVSFEGLDDITHIWFSHEHSDHFSPSFLRSIPEGRRSDITVLYQLTKDKRVISFCKRLGFNAVELPDRHPLKIADDMEILCGKSPFYDSWSIVRANGLCLVNLNDCILASKSELLEIASLARTCDVLFTQFSEAAWGGNPEEPAMRREKAELFLRRIAHQCAALQPKFVVPFASFIFFSHTENFYMNDSANDLETAVDFISRHCDGTPIVLTPGELWDGRTAKNNTSGLAAWMDKYRQARTAPLQTIRPVPQEEIYRAAGEFMERVRQKNCLFVIKLLCWIKILPTVRFYVWDHDRGYSFSWTTGLAPDDTIERQEADVSLGSDSLWFVFAQDYGVDTLNGNARFRATPQTRGKLVRTFMVPTLNNMGIFVNLSLLGTMMNVEFVRQGLRTVGLIKRRF